MLDGAMQRFTLLFKSVTELNFVVVPYRGPAELSIALLRNDVDVVINAYGGLRQGIDIFKARNLQRGAYIIVGVHRTEQVEGLKHQADAPAAQPPAQQPPAAPPAPASP